MLREPILPDSDPVYPTYWYVVDGRTALIGPGYRSIGDYRRRNGFPEVRKCDLAGRGALLESSAGIITHMPKRHPPRNPDRPKNILPNGDERDLS